MKEVCVVDGQVDFGARRGGRFEEHAANVAEHFVSGEGGFDAMTRK